MSQLKIPIYQSSLGSSKDLKETLYTRSKRRFQTQIFDPFQIPPNIDISKNHQKATRVSKPLSIQQQNYSQFCPCCQLPIQNRLININCKTKQLAHVGISYCMYFEYIKFCFILVAINLLLSGSIQIVLNYTGSICQQIGSKNIICTSSIINIMDIEDKYLMSIQNILSCFFVLVSFPLIEGFKVKQKIFHNKIQRKVFLIENYSFILRNVSPSATIKNIKQQVIKFLQNSHLSEQQNKMVKIYFIYDLQDYIKLYEQQFNLIKKVSKINQQYVSLSKTNVSEHKKLEHQERVNSKLSEIHKFNAKKNQIIQQIQLFQNNFTKFYYSQNISEVQSQYKFTGNCIITMNSKQSVKYIIQNHNDITNKSYNPTDFIFSKFWRSLTTKKHTHIMVIYINMLIGVNFFILTILKKVIKFQKSDTLHNQNNIIFVSLISGLVCNGFNTLLSLIIIYYSRRNPSYNTVSDYQKYTTKQLTIILLMNMIVVIYFSNIVSFWLISYGETTYLHFVINFLDLIYDFFFLFLINIITICLYNLLDLSWLYRLYKRNRIKNCLDVTQAQANLYFQNHPIALSTWYTNINKIILLTASIVSIIPITLQITLLTLILLYWIKKYLLLRRYNCRHKLSQQFDRQMINQLEYYPFLVSFFNFILMFVPIKENTKYTYPNNQNTVDFYIALIAWLLSIVFLFSSKKYLQSIYYKIFKDSLKKQNSKFSMLYLDNQNHFAEDYGDHYPYHGITTNITDSEQKFDMKLFQNIKWLLDENRYRIN